MKFFFWNLMLWDGFWVHFWAYDNTLSFHFSPGMVTEFLCPHGWRLVSISIGGSGTPKKLCEKVAYKSQSKFCFTFSLHPIPSNARWECVATVLKTCSFSCLCSSLLCSDHEVVWAWICADDICVSCLQGKGWRHHLSQNIGQVVTGSAGPVPPPPVASVWYSLLMF